MPENSGVSLLRSGRARPAERTFRSARAVGLTHDKVRPWG